MMLLERHFEIALETPDGVMKLRELILSLAVQGKLVKLDLKEQPAIELLKEIEIEKNKQIGEGKIKKRESFSFITPSEIPYEVPSNWVWTKLSELGEINPRNNSNDEMTAGFIPMSLIYAEYGKNHKFLERKWGEIKKGFTHFRNNDVVLAKITPCFENGKSCVIKNLPNQVGAGTTELLIFRNSFLKIYPEYVLAFLKSPFFFVKGIPKMTGSAGQKRLPREYFSSTPFPLPPFCEQKRIVAKIDQLMHLCDKLESERNERINKQLKIHHTVITRLLSASDKIVFNASWNFITKNFNEIYSIPDNVEELKKAILQLAFMGKLLPQDQKEKSASELLKEIGEEKKRFNIDGKMKKPEKFSLIRLEDMPYQLPNGWIWVRLGEIAQHNSGKTLDSGRNIGISREYITTSNLYWGYFELNSLKKMPFKDNELERCTATKGDLLICEGGEAGRASVWENDYDICFQNHIHRVRLFCNINPYYIYRFFQKINFTGEINVYRKGVGISNMSGKSLSSIPIPLPPIAEQNRIISKVNQLIEICNTFIEELNCSSEKRSAIFSSILAQK